MGLVVHVTLRRSNSQGVPIKFPFEISDDHGLRTFDDFLEYLEAGGRVRGLRLWLDRPQPPNFLNLPDEPELDHIPNRARVILKADPWVLVETQVDRVVPWITGRVVRYEDT